MAAIYLLKTIAFPVLFIAAIPSLATAERSRTDYVMSGNLKQQKGDLDGAIKDYSQAIRLSAKSRFQLYDLRGLARLEMGASDRAIADFNRSIQLYPQYGEAYFDRGMAEDLLRKWKSSLADYRRSVELISAAPLEGETTDYPHLNIWIVRTRLGDGETANGELSTYLAQRDVNPPHDWIWKIGSYFLGAITEENLLHAAILRNAGTNRDSRCEAWYYIGIRKLLSGERKAAADCFRKSLATKQSTSMEFIFSQSELEALRK